MEGEEICNNVNQNATHQKGDDVRKLSQLNAGFICNNDIYDEVAKEVLNHQGILYKEIHERIDRNKKFPCVILPSYVDDNYEVARDYCETEENIVIVEKEIPLNVVLDAFGGTLETSSINPIYPVINQYEIELLMKIKEKYYALGLPFVKKWFWPRFLKACYIMTHDVDWLYYSPWHWAALRRKTIPQIAKLVYQSILKRKNFGNNILEILSTEISKNVRSSFFFLSEYEKVYQKKFVRYLKKSQEHGFEIGLHGYYSHDDLARLKEQKKTLEKYAETKLEGIRQHELNFLAPLTWKYEEEAGFIYDLTLSYNETFGFRGGICFPYHPISLLENRRFSILEMPTTFMDWTVLHNRMKHNEAMRMFAMIWRNVEKFNGLFVTCFHNTYLNEETFPEISKLYHSILNDLSQRNYWVTTASECCKWWLKREKTRIDVKIKGKSISGQTTTYPIPLLVETTRGERKRAEIYGEQFKVDLA